MIGCRAASSLAILNLLCGQRYVNPSRLTHLAYFLFPTVLPKNSFTEQQNQDTSGLYTVPSVRRPILIWNAVIWFFGYERSVYPLGIQFFVETPRRFPFYYLSNMANSPCLFLDTPVSSKIYSDRISGYTFCNRTS